MEINNLNMHTIYTNQRRSTDLIYKKDPKNPNLSLINCAMLILNLNFGMEMFYLDEMYQDGYILMLFLSIIAYLLSFGSFILLTKCWIYGQSFSFMTIWENAIGPSFHWIPDFLIVLCYFQYTSQYYPMALTLIQEIVAYFSTEQNPLPSILSDQFFIIYIFIAIPSILISFVKEIHSFVIISWIKIICLAIIIGIHIYKFIETLNTPAFSITHNFQVSIFGTFTKFCTSFVYALSITCHQPIIEHIVQVMKKPTLSRTIKIYFYPTFIGFIVFILFTTLTTLMSGRRTYDMFVSYFYDPDDKITICSKFFSLFYALTTLYFWQWMEARHFSQVFSGSWELSHWMNIFWIPNLLSCFIVIIVNASGCFFPYLAIIITDILGKIGTTSICLILAPVFYLRMFGTDKSKKLWIILSLLFIISGFFLIAYTVYIDSNEIVYLV